MLECESIVKLYNDVLENDISEYDLSVSDIQVGIISMAKVYDPIKNGKKTDRSVVADFNDAAHRCAYLHKFAPLHTAMVRDLTYSAIRKNYDFFEDLLSDSDFKMCSLGGGPGSDVVGVLASLVFTYGHLRNFDFTATVIDYMAEWGKTFRSVMEELTSGRHGGNFGRKSLRWRFLGGANLLKSLDPEVEREISSASLVTAVKFVSATNCKNTESMVESVFSAMKPGAVFFFIDNAGGGFRECVLDIAAKFNFIPRFGPVPHEDYSNELVKLKRFGHFSCYKTSVCVAILQKPYQDQPRLRITVPSASEDNLSLGHTPLTPYVFRLFDRAFTPDLPNIANSAKTPRRRRNKIKNRCLPLLKMEDFRLHLIAKLNSFKSHIQSKRRIRKKQRKVY